MEKIQCRLAVFIALIACWLCQPAECQLAQDAANAYPAQPQPIGNGAYAPSVSSAYQPNHAAYQYSGAAGATRHVPYDGATTGMIPSSPMAPQPSPPPLPQPSQAIQQPSQAIQQPSQAIQPQQGYVANQAWYSSGPLPPYSPAPSYSPLAPYSAQNAGMAPVTAGPPAQYAQFNAAPYQPNPAGYPPASQWQTAPGGARMVPLFTAPETQPDLSGGAPRFGPNGVTGANNFQPPPAFVAMRTGGTELDKRWSTNRLPLRVCIQPGEGIPRYKPGFLQVVHRSCEEWTTSSNGAVKFEYVDDAENCDIKIEFVEYCNDIGHKKADGVTQLYYDKWGNIRFAHIFLATTMPNRYLQGKQDSHTMRATAIHEIGHALGLSHSPRSNDIMYFQNHSRQRIMVQGIIPINIPLPAGISGNDRRRILMLYGSGSH